jgi:hypothetical protein
MAAGRAHGQNRDYQVFCRNILQILSDRGGLLPYEDDGIDVSFEMGGTTWTLDIALRDSEGKIVVAECKRWQDPIKQEHIAAFAYKVELLRKQTGGNVAGIFFTKTKYQIGAVKAAAGAGIEVAVCDQDQSLQQFVLSYQKYDPEREARLQKVLAYLTGSVRPKGSLKARVIRADGTIEDEMKLG